MHIVAVGSTPNSSNRSPTRKFSRGGAKRKRHRNYSHMVTDGRKHTKYTGGGNGRTKDDDSDDGMTNDISAYYMLFILFSI